MTSGCHQLKLHPISQKISAIHTPEGIHYYVRLPYGLKQGPPLFQRASDEVVAPIKEYAIVYIDDIIIFSPDMKSHFEHLWKFFERVKEVEMMRNFKKAQFLKKEVSLLGHIVGYGKVKPNPK